MTPEISPAPEADEAAAIAAVIALLGEAPDDTPPPRPSRWRMAGRDYAS